MVLKNIFLVSLLNVIRGGITLFLTFLIARFIPPSDYGVVAFTFPFLAFLTLLTDLGIANAILREKSLTKVMAGSCMSLLLYLVIVFSSTLFAISYPIESTTGIHGLTPVLRGFCFVLFFQVASTVPRALLEREQLYGNIFICELIALISALVVFSYSILNGLGVMSLVYYHIVLQVLRALGLILYSSSFMTWHWRPREISSIINSGSWIFGSNLLSFSSRNVDKWIVGTTLGQGALGLYGFAYQIMTIPLVLIAWPSSNILLTNISKINITNDQKQRFILSFIGLTALFVFPVAVYTSTNANVLVRLFVSNRWADSAPLITWLAPVGAIQALAVYATAVLVSNGWFKTNLTLNFINGLFIPLIFYFACDYGIDFAVKVYSVTSILIVMAMIFMLCKSEAISPESFRDALTPALCVSFCALFLSETLNFIIQDSNLLAIFAIKTIVYIATCLSIVLVFRKKLRESLTVFRIG